MEQVNLVIQNIINDMQKNAKQFPIDTSLKKVPPKKPLLNVPCKHCGGTGDYRFYDKKGMPDIKPCEYCAAERKMVAMLMQSGINPKDYARYTLEKFDPNVNATARLLKNTAIRYLSQHPADVGFGAFGNSGNGKTHICVAVCQELTRRYHEPHYYFSYVQEMPKLVKAVKSYRDNETYESLITKWRTCENLYIDDLFKNAEAFAGNGILRLKDEEKGVILDIVMSRYQKRLKTFFSSEYSVEQITKIDAALGSRIFEMVYPYGIFVNDRNLRYKLARNRNN